MSFTSGTQARDGRTATGFAARAHGCTCGECGIACKYALCRPCCGACMAEEAFDVLDNPVLVAFREDFGKHSRTGNVSRFAFDCLRYWRETNNRIGTPEQIDHARRVLEKLAVRA